LANYIDVNMGLHIHSLFIIISGIGAVGAFFLLPETKGIPLEEMAKLFGDDEHIAVYAAQLHFDPNKHELVVDENGLQHIATEADHSHAQTIGEKTAVPLHNEKV
jgi:hypothetical protein